MRYYLVNLLLFFLPSSRFFGFKRWLLSLCGAKVGRNVRVMRIRVAGIKLFIGDNSFIGDETLIMGGEGKIVIGKNCDISSRVNIISGTHEYGGFKQAAGRGYSEDIIIGDGVWIGFGSTILHGVKIGEGAIIAAGSVVTHNVNAHTLVAGVPAKEKKRLGINL